MDLTLTEPEFAKPVKLLFVAAPYEAELTEQLVRGAMAALPSQVSCEVQTIPGVLEIPTVIGMAERMSNYDGYVALGAVLPDPTGHHVHLRESVARGLMMLGLQGLCIGNAVLTAGSAEEALPLADPAGRDSGGGAVRAALHLVALARKWGAPRAGVGFLPSSEEYQIAGNPEGRPTA